jgi:hypothetical protein
MNNNPFPEGMNMRPGISSDNFPMSEENQMLNSLIEDKGVPKNIKEKFWYVFSKDHVLTFLDKDRKKNKLLAFDIIKLDNMMNMGYYEYNFETEKEYNQLRLIFETKLDRALGTDKASQLNERIVQKSQFSENRNFVSENNNSVKGKFFNRLIGRG